MAVLSVVRVFIVIVVMSLLSLGGCYRSPDITYHTPGVYKGPRDPLLQKERSPEQQQRLLQRFNQVQTDR
jgi:hypothetical protein